VNTPGPRLVTVLLLLAVGITACGRSEQTTGPAADAAAASEAAEVRSRLPVSASPSPEDEPSVEVSVPPQPAALARNPLYRTGRLPAARCREPRREPTSVASVRAYYTELLACLNKAWAPAVREAGFTFRPPRLVVTKGRSAASPCEFAAGQPYYCGGTIFMDAQTDIDAYDDDPEGARVWMAFTLGHEYGHHVQTLVGIMATRYERSLTLNGVDAALEESRRFELQASCLAAVYLGADRSSFPITDAWRDAFDYLVRNSDDPERDHGKPANHGYWSVAGLDAADPAVCNTYTAGSALVS
jgi:predicted metalloprotease